MDSERLTALAGRFASGMSIDWESEVHAATDEEERAVVESMRMLESISRAHLAAQAAAPEEATIGMPTASRSARVEPMPTPERWGRLEKLSRIGEGSFGVVYRAWDPNLEIWVALKLAKPRPHGAANRQILEEAKLLARPLEGHENVVRIYDAAEHDGRVGISMELLEGRTLQELVDFSGPMDEQQAMHVGQRIARAVAEIHRAGVIHKDIKARNIMQALGGRIVLMDFGAGVRRPEDGIDAVWMSGLRGTPYYLAPEELEGQAPSEKSDIYSLGVLLFFLVTGKYPVEGGSIDELKANHRSRQRRSLAVVRPSLTSRFCAVVDRAMHSDPAERFENASLMARALESGPIPEPHPEPVAVAPPPTNGHRRRVMLAGVGAALLLGGLAYVIDSRVLRYSVEASFYRQTGGMGEIIRPGSRVRPGDRLYLEFVASKPLYTYILNWDERGQAAILFPIPGAEPHNPLPANVAHQLPGTIGSQAVYWQVTSAGEREHYLIATSRKPLPELEAALSHLRPARLGHPIEFPTVDPENALRGTLGLETGDAPTSVPIAESLRRVRELTDAPDRQRGVWMRRVDLDNPHP